MAGRRSTLYRPPCALFSGALRKTDPARAVQPFCRILSGGSAR